MEKEDLPSYGDINNGVTTPEPSAPGVGNEPLPVEYIPPPSFPPLTQSEIKQACHFYVVEKCCFGTRFIENMSMTDRSDRIAYRYTLETFGEKRETTEELHPFNGGPVDGPENGPPLSAWDIPVTPTKNFEKEKKIVQIPHTSYVKSCVKCSGVGGTTCLWCAGIGGRGCLLCIASSKNLPCTSCRLSNRSCMFCNGCGKQMCQKCDGRGKLRASKILVVTWTNHTEEFVSDTMNLPSEEIIQNAHGKQIFTDEAKELSPLWNVASPSAVEASKELINKHRSKFQNEVIRRQRHTLTAVPFTHIKYFWNNEVGEFYVYGTQKKVYFDNYPQHCCCCCTIM